MRRQISREPRRLPSQQGYDFVLMNFSGLDDSELGLEKSRAVFYMVNGQEWRELPARGARFFRRNEAVAVFGGAEVTITRVVKKGGMFREHVPWF